MCAVCLEAETCLRPLLLFREDAPRREHVVNDNGGTALASAFTISLGDSGNTVFGGVESPGVTYTFDEGYAFTVTEIGLPGGYAQTGQPRRSPSGSTLRAT